MNNVLSFLKSPLTIFGFSFLVLIAAVFMGLNLNSPSAIEGLSKTKIKIIPVINIEEEKTNCLLEQNILSASIDTPSENQEFMMGAPIELKGNYDFKCKTFFTAEELQIRTEWSLGDSGSTFSEDQNTTLNNSTPGNHKVNFKVKVEIDGEIFEASVGRNFRVKAPVTQTPTPTPTQAPNQPPVANITAPNDGSSYNGCPLIIAVAGNGSDAEDGTLSGTSLSWYYIDQGVRTDFGTGTNSAFILNDYVVGVDNRIINIYLTATDSQGISTQDSIKITVNTDACG